MNVAEGRPHGGAAPGFVRPDWRRTPQIWGVRFGVQEACTRIFATSREAKL